MLESAKDWTDSIQICIIIGWKYRCNWSANYTERFKHYRSVNMDFLCILCVEQLINVKNCMLYM